MSHNVMPISSYKIHDMSYNNEADTDETQKEEQ